MTVHLLSAAAFPLSTKILENIISTSLTVAQGIPSGSFPSPNTSANSGVLSKGISPPLPDTRSAYTATICSTVSQSPASTACSMRCCRLSPCTNGDTLLHPPGTSSVVQGQKGMRLPAYAASSCFPSSSCLRIWSPACMVQAYLYTFFSPASSVTISVRIRNRSARSLEYFE